MASDVGSLKSAPLPLRGKVDAKALDEKLHEVAALYEEQFMREMVKAMRGTVPEGGLVKVSQGEEIYREQLDQKYVNQWSKQGGVGLQDMIYKQLIDKYGPVMGLKKNLERPQGPLPLDAKSNFAPQFRQVDSSLQVQFKKSGAQQGYPEKLTNPWAGQLLGVQEINPNEYVMQLAHDNGRTSQLVFRGILDSGLAQKPAGEPIAAGAYLGTLSPEAQNIFWNLK